jgi:hypothetical protein
VLTPGDGRRHPSTAPPCEIMTDLSKHLSEVPFDPWALGIKCPYRTSVVHSAQYSK